MTRLTTLLLAILITSTCVGKTAKIKVERIFHSNSYDRFDSIVFIINGVQLTGMDTTFKTIKLNKDLDKCFAIMGTDTLKFLTKFQRNNTYIIRPGCCCAEFTLEAEKNPRRGTVSYKNLTERDLGLILAEANYDTIIANNTKELFSHESAMCLFKPCNIALVETEYINEIYDYSNNDLANYDSLQKVQESFVLANGYFLFLHGEKIEIIFEEKTETIHFKLNGYLTYEEFKQWHN